jgi:nitroreductase
MDLSEFHRFLACRSSVRQYQDREVPEDLLDEIIAATKNAPSAGNLEAWDVVVVREPGMREAVADAAFKQQHIIDAPVVLVVCGNFVRSMSRYEERGILYALEDGTIAATYMMLAAHAAGLSTCWNGAFDEEELREALALPAHLRPLTLLTLGYAAETPIPPARMDTREHIHHEEW